MDAIAGLPREAASLRDLLATIATKLGKRARKGGGSDAMAGRRLVRLCAKLGDRPTALAVAKDLGIKDAL